MATKLYCMNALFWFYFLFFVHQKGISWDFSLRLLLPFGLVLETGTLFLHRGRGVRIQRGKEYGGLRWAGDACAKISGMDTLSAMDSLLFRAYLVLLLIRISSWFAWNFISFRGEEEQEGSWGRIRDALKERNESRNRPIWKRVLFVPLWFRLVSYLWRLINVMKYARGFEEMVFKIY